MSQRVSCSTVADIDPVSLYDILRLRNAVFVHEQRIVDEEELDGRDIEPTTTLYWIEDDGVVAATLRVLADGPVTHIGRVATAVKYRGRGLAAQLMESALQNNPGAIDISAQAYLEQWYRRFGFVRNGPGYLEAGIDHVPMTRP